MSWRVLEADCVEAMREMDEASVDAIVTDPPYGLEFMGKEWDRLGDKSHGHAGVDRSGMGLPRFGPWSPSADEKGVAQIARHRHAMQEWHQAWATEALRVLKPGGHLLAFGGTRTYHRLACAVEDAGFEIRDSIAWHHMSHVFCQCDNPLYAGKTVSEHDLRSMRDADVSEAVPAEGGEGEVLLEGVPESSAPGDGSVSEQGAADGAEPSMEGRGDSEAPEGELRGGALCESARVGEADGPEGRLRDGASAGDGAEAGPPANEDGVRSPPGSRPGEQPADELGAMAVEWIAQGRGAWPGCPGCGKPLAPPVFAGPLAHTYGSGFPKSLAVDKAIGRANGRKFEDRYALGRHIRSQREAAKLSQAEVNGWFNYRDGCQHWERQDSSGARVPTLADWKVLSERLDLSDEFFPLVERAEAERKKIGEVHSGLHRGSGTTVAFGEGTDRSMVDLTVPRHLPECESCWNCDGTGSVHQEGEYACQKCRGEGLTCAPGCPVRWQGWGTALAPSHEPIVVARKPLTGTVASNVQRWGTGAINIDDSRTNGEQGRWPKNCVLSHLPECERVGERRVKGSRIDKPYEGDAAPGYKRDFPTAARGARGIGDTDGLETVETWRCATDEHGNNLCPVAELDRQSGERRSAGEYEKGKARPVSPIDGLTAAQYSDSGSASRFFYVAKASRAERGAGLDGERNIHPTCKPVTLMRWLIRLVTPPGGRVLDPFLGSGTTGVACVLEGFDFIGIEREAEYVEIAQARIAWWDTHKDRAEEILSLSAKSERERQEHVEAGQLSLDEAA